MTARGSFVIGVCWLVFVVGVLLVPMICVFGALVTAGPVEYSGPQPPWSSSSIALVWIARIAASACGACVLIMTVIVTARGGRLVNGWVVLVLTVPVVFLLWEFKPD